LQGTIAVIRYTDGSYSVTFYPLSRQNGNVPDYTIPNLDGLRQFLSSINVVLTEEQTAVLTSAKSLAIHNVNPADDILKRYGLIDAPCPFGRRA
jgi:hypothetical protein